MDNQEVKELSFPEIDELETLYLSQPIINHKVDAIFPSHRITRQRLVELQKELVEYRLHVERRFPYRDPESYAAAEITFIDRTTQTETVYTYPVTRVVLRERDHPERGRIFAAQSDGTWKEDEE